MVDLQSAQNISDTNKIWVVIPAAGVGERMQLAYPKQYEKIKGKTIIEYTLDCFIQHSDIAGIVCVVDSKDYFWQKLSISSDLKPIHTVIGGENRSDSVLHGLNYLYDEEGISFNSWVMVHDAARPCLSQADIDGLLFIRKTNTIGGLLAHPVRDSMKRTKTNKRNHKQVDKSEPREHLWHALTPQIFRLGDLITALKSCRDQGIYVSDESSAMEVMGEHPVIVEGSQLNIKITYPSDIELASLILKTISKTERQQCTE